MTVKDFNTILAALDLGNTYLEIVRLNSDKPNDELFFQRANLLYKAKEVLIKVELTDG